MVWNRVVTSVSVKVEPSAANCFTVAVTTGPVPEEALYDHGADIVYPTMAAFAEALPTLIALRSEYK